MKWLEIIIALVIIIIITSVILFFWIKIATKILVNQEYHKIKNEIYRFENAYKKEISDAMKAFVPWDQFMHHLTHLVFTDIKNQPEVVNDKDIIDAIESYLSSTDFMKKHEMLLQWLYKIKSNYDTKKLESNIWQFIVNVLIFSVQKRITEIQEKQKYEQR